MMYNILSQIGAVNADDHKSLGGQYQVQGFPTIKLIKAGDNSIVDFDGERTEAGFVKFLDAQVGAETAASKDEL